MNVKLYKAMACSHMDCGVTLALSCYERDAKVLESVQRRATKPISTLQDKTLKECFISLKLPTLVYYIKRRDVMTTCKLLESDLLGHVFSPFLSAFTRGKTKKLQPPLPHYN